MTHYWSNISKLATGKARENQPKTILCCVFSSRRQRNQWIEDNLIRAASKASNLLLIKVATWVFHISVSSSFYVFERYLWFHFNLYLIEVGKPLCIVVFIFVLYFCNWICCIWLRWVVGGGMISWPAMQVALCAHQQTTSLWSGKYKHKYKYKYKYHGTNKLPPSDQGVPIRKIQIQIQI